MADGTPTLPRHLERRASRKVVPLSLLVSLDLSSGSQYETSQLLLDQAEVRKLVQHGPVVEPVRFHSRDQALAELPERFDLILPELHVQSWPRCRPQHTPQGGIAHVSC